MIFTALTLHLRLHHATRPLTVADGPFLHAAIMRAVTAADRALGVTLHDAQRHKSLTIAPVSSTLRFATVRVTCMRDDGLRFVNALVDVLNKKPNLTIGAFTCTVESADLTGSSWTGIATWTDLHSDSAGSRIRFTFRTPTAIMKDTHQGTSRYTALLPDPQGVFMGLMHRWRALNGPPLPATLEEYLLVGGCVISTYNLQTYGFTTRHGFQIGFVGQCVYTCRLKDVACIRALNALARFASYCGVGYHTAQGMGLTVTAIDSPARGDTHEITGQKDRW